MKKNIRTIISIASPILIAVITTVVTDKLTEIDIIGKILMGITNIFRYFSFRIQTPVWLFLSLVITPIFIWYFSTQPTTKNFIRQKTKFLVHKKQTKSYPDIDTLVKGNELTSEAKLCILGYQNQSSILAYKKGLCCSDYEPGTFTLAEISPDASFLKGSMSFIDWANKTLEQEVGHLKNTFPSLFNKRSTAETKELTKKILTMKGPTGRSLHQEVWFQEYSDVIRRIILLVTINNPDFDLDIYPNLTNKRRKITYDVLNYIEEKKHPDLREWLFVSVAAGLLGVDEKSNHAATSDIDIYNEPRKLDHKLR